MKFKVVKSSEQGENHDDVFINIETLEDFMTWVSKQNDPVIVSVIATVRSHKEDYDYEIPELEIYDDYRE